MRNHLKLIAVFLVLSLGACDDCDENCQSRQKQSDAREQQERNDVQGQQDASEKAKQAEVDKIACTPQKIGTTPEGITMYVISHNCSRVPSNNDIYITSQGKFERGT